MSSPVFWPVPLNGGNIMAKMQLQHNGDEHNGESAYWARNVIINCFLSPLGQIGITIMFLPLRGLTVFCVEFLQTKNNAFYVNVK